MTTPFPRLTKLSQIARLRPVAIRFADEFNIQPQSLNLVHYGYNATYKVITQTGQKLALKLILDSPRELPHLKAELTWCTQLASKGIPVAQPLSSLVPVGQLAGYTKPIYAQCFHWLPGRQFPQFPTQVQLHKVAQLYRQLHESPPVLQEDEYFPNCDEPLVGTECRITDPLILDTLGECTESFKKLWKTQPATPIHFDLHAQNLIYNRGIVHPFDFEFSHFAPPLIDIADLFFSFHYPKTVINLEDAIWPAFNYRPSDFGLSEREFQSLIVARKILLYNDLYHTSNPDLKSILERSHKSTKLLVEQFNRTNRYDPSVLL